MSTDMEKVKRTRGDVNQGRPLHMEAVREVQRAAKILRLQNAIASHPDDKARAAARDELATMRPRPGK